MAEVSIMKTSLVDHCDHTFEHNWRTSDRGAGRPRRNGILPLIEEDVGSPCAHVSLRNCLSTAVIIAIPLAIHRVPTEGYTIQVYLIDFFNNVKLFHYLVLHP